MNGQPIDVPPAFDRAYLETGDGVTITRGDDLQAALPYMDGDRIKDHSMYPLCLRVSVTRVNAPYDGEVV
jgi:hypothetical protein